MCTDIPELFVPREAGGQKSRLCKPEWQMWTLQRQRQNNTINTMNCMPRSTALSVCIFVQISLNQCETTQVGKVLLESQVTYWFTCASPDWFLNINYSGAFRNR